MKIYILAVLIVLSLANKLSLNGSGIVKIVMSRIDTLNDEIDLSNDKGTVRFNGNTSIETEFTYVYPITDYPTALLLYKKLLFFRDVSMDTKNIYFKFLAKEISEVSQKRRGEFGDVYSLEITRDTIGTFTIHLLTAKDEHDANALYNIINDLPTSKDFEIDN